MTDHWPIWHASVRQPEIDHSISKLYNELDAEVREKNPTCWISGRCCDFDAYGHRLYVTGLEIAWVLHQLAKDQPEILASSAEQSPKDPCVFQRDKMCSIHTVRPLGCRIFFCQEGTDQWQQDVYERFMGQLRNIHNERELPYGYMEWRVGLQEARATENASEDVG